MPTQNAVCRCFFLCVWSCKPCLHSALLIQKHCVRLLTNALNVFPSSWNICKVHFFRGLSKSNSVYVHISLPTDLYFPVFAVVLLCILACDHHLLISVRLLAGLHIASPFHTCPSACTRFIIIILNMGRWQFRENFGGSLNATFVKASVTFEADLVQSDHYGARYHVSPWIV